jgi:hypothetical protein
LCDSMMRASIPAASRIAASCSTADALSIIAKKKEWRLYSSS